MKTYITKKTGFTILELLFAITIWITGFLAISNLLQISFGSARSARRHLIASHLGQEGVEIIHNQRDGKFLASSPPWHVVSKSHACFDNQGCEVDFQNGGDIYDKSGEPYLKYSTTTNSYGYFAADSDIITTDYKRNVYLTLGDDLPAGEGPPCQEIATSSLCLQIVSEVSWKERGKEKAVEVESYLFKWD